MPPRTGPRRRAAALRSWAEPASRAPASPPGGRATGNSLVRQLPETYSTVVASRNGPEAVRREGDGVHRHGMAVHAAHLLAAGEVPQMDESINISGQGSPAVRRERDAAHLAVIALQLLEFFPGGHIP